MVSKGPPAFGGEGYGEGQSPTPGNQHPPPRIAPTRRRPHSSLTHGRNHMSTYPNTLLHIAGAWRGGAEGRSAR
jgi:hypothetical protein